MEEKPKKINCCNTTFRILILGKIFPKEGEADSFKFLIPMYTIGLLIFCKSLFVILYIIIGLKGYYEIEQIKFGIVEFVSLVGTMWVIFFLVKNRHILIELAERISDFSKFGEPPGYKEFETKWNFFAKIHFVYASGAGTFAFLVFAPMHVIKCNSINIEKNATEICSMIFPIYIPGVGYHSLNNLPSIIIIDIFEYVILTYVHAITATVMFLNLEIVEYLRIKIRHMNALILTAFEGKHVSKRRKQFSEAVQYHNDILIMSKLIRTFFGRELILHIILTGAIMGVCAFLMIQDNTIEVIMIFIGWLFCILMGCISGQRLIDESETIPRIMYNVDWYDFDKELKKNIIIFLIKTQHPMFIQAGHVIMNNKQIVEILKMAYSCYTLFLAAFNNI
ncbi:uncharacterized protein LOC126748527 isoform X2 [Anthonomus grandis grandis]|nr:uncharacterized protein LOC126748527 isoform X2 [Anthonomus grandis grandis]